MLRGHLIALCVLSALIAPAGALAAGPHKPAGPGSIGIRLVEAPSGAHDDPLGHSYIVGRLALGATIRRSVEISNSTRSTAIVAVYPAAAGFSHGRFAFAPGRSPNELSSWTSLSRAALRLSAGTKALETVTVTVPRNASSGEHYAVVWAQVSTRPAAAGGVTLVNRVGVRMYLSIGPGGAPAPNFTIGRLTVRRSPSGELLVLATVHNSGGRTVAIVGTLTLSKGPGGLRAGPFPVKLGTALAPSDSESGTVRLDKRLPLGPWRVEIQLTSGLVHRTAAATLTFPRQR